MAEDHFSRFAYSLDDGSASVEVSEVALSDGRNRFTNTWSRREPSSNPIWSWDLERRMVKQYSNDHSKAATDQFERMIDFATPDAQRDLGDAMKGPLLRYLGYETQSIGNRNADESLLTTVFTYPSAATFNNFMDKVFGNDGSARFQVYPGAEFPADEFVKTLVKDGKILVARDAPFSAHDMSDHALGWLAIPPFLFQAIREAATEHQDHKGAIINIAGTLDSLSAMICGDMFKPPISAVLWQQLGRHYRAYLSYIGDGEGGELEFMHLPGIEHDAGQMIETATIDRVGVIEKYVGQNLLAEAN